MCAMVARATSEVNHRRNAPAVGIISALFGCHSRRGCLRIHFKQLKQSGKAGWVQFMTHRLLVNPDTNQQWEIPLPPGTFRIGRRDDNDHQISHPSVSGAHCEIIVDGTGVQIRDLDSTNGTFVNRAPVRETRLVSGQHLQLGSVDLRFESDGATEPAAVTPAAISPGPLRLARSSPAAVEEPSEPPMAPPLVAPTAIANTGQFFCKSHVRTPARYLCPKCHKYFCELCVITRPGAASKMCRACGVPLTPLHVQNFRTAKPRGFYSRLPGAFVFPFRGSGLLILICATIAFAALGFIASGLLSIFAKIIFYGFLFLFMQNIIFCTTSDEHEPLSFPSADDLFGGAFQLVGTVLVSYGLTVALLVARFYEVDVPGAAIIATFILGSLYFPMAFLAVAMKDTVLAANPLVVIPAILKMPLEYLVAAILLMSVFAIRLLGSFVSGVAGAVTFSTRDMSALFVSMGVQTVWAFLSVYLLTVNMRILGQLYNARKEKFGWFSH
jgi:pSer/pThr/pTyr-binding forkhead associated (FHA) protein